MKNLLLASALLTLILGLGNCGGATDDGGSSQDGSVFARVSWTEDVTGLDMEDVGIADLQLASGSVHPLEFGRGTVYWVSSGVAYSRTMNVGFSDGGEDEDIECEQEGEHEGENEGCMFELQFSGDTLSVQRVN